MNRITQKDLQSNVDYLNVLTNSPLKYRDESSTTFKSNIGHYHLDGAYGGWKLVRICNEGGGQSDISTIGYASKRELYNWINAYTRGLNALK
jgi:hypothetical protein